MDTVDEMVRDELISGEVANIIMARVKAFNNHFPPLVTDDYPV